MLRLLILAILSTAALPAQTYFTRPLEAPAEESPGVMLERFYLKTYNGQEMQVEFRYPAARPASGFPAIIYVLPWGGVRGGMRGMGIREPSMVVREGIAVALFYFPGAEDNPSPDQVLDKYGPERQLQLRDLIRYVASREDVDAANVGLMSFSSANVLVAGAITRPPGEPELKYWIDGEGPTTRHVLMLNIPGTMAAAAAFRDEEHQGEWMSRQFVGASLGDEDYWREREAFRLMKKMRCRFLRLQGEQDHVHHWYYGHAIHALNSAMASESPWIRGGAGPVNVWHRDASTIDMLPGRIGRQGDRVLGFIKEMVNHPPLGELPEDGRKPEGPARPGISAFSKPR